MKRVTLLLLLVVTFAAPVWAYRLIYKEQLYPLVHEQLYMRPENYAENVRWLEAALSADFANPLYAMARVETPREHEYYRALFWMHLNLEMTRQYLGWAGDYMKFDAYYFNYPWRDDNLESLIRAEELFEIARYYWSEAVAWSAEAAQFRWMHLPEIQYWADQSYRIEHGELDYDAIIDRHVRRLEEVRAEFQAMDDSTF